MTTIRQKKGKHRLECTGECVRERSERINNLGVVVWITSEIGHVVTDGNQSVTLLRFSNLAFSSLTFTTFESAYAPRSEAGTCRRRASPKHELKPPKKSNLNKAHMNGDLFKCKPRLCCYFNHLQTVCIDFCTCSTRPNRLFDYSTMKPFWGICTKKCLLNPTPPSILNWNVVNTGKYGEHSHGYSPPYFF